MDSWQGRAWAIFFGWTFCSIPITLEYYFYDSDYSLLIQLGIIATWFLWLYGLYHFIILMKDLFRDKIK